MRVLSFIPAILLAAASFVVAAPAPQCVQPGDDKAVQPIINIFTNATQYMQPYEQKLSAAKSGTPDVDAVSAIVVEINAIVEFTVVQLQAAARVNLSVVDVTTLGAAIYVYLGVVVSVLGDLLAIVLALSGGIVVNLKGDITALLNSVLTLVVCLKIFVAASLAVLLGPVLLTVTGLVNVILGVVANVKVVAAVVAAAGVAA